MAQLGAHEEPHQQPLPEHAPPAARTRAVHQRAQGRARGAQPLRAARIGRGAHRPRRDPRRRHDAAVQRARGVQRGAHEPREHDHALAARHRAARRARDRLRHRAQPAERPHGGAHRAHHAQGHLEDAEQRARLRNLGPHRGLLQPHPPQPLDAQAHAPLEELRRAHDADDLRLGVARGADPRHALARRRHDARLPRATRALRALVADRRLVHHHQRPQLPVRQVGGVGEPPQAQELAHTGPRSAMKKSGPS
mmetsp:Transcript_98/g.354  ORF Transcript_98/g.354 Transcript_98/m.354 type:complete len:252 (-) Transcript_98:359-1114(-)